MDLRSHLRVEYHRRRGRNPRYSLRAFALDVGACHSTLLRCLAGGRRITRETIDVLIRHLGLLPRDADGARLHEGEREVLRLVGRSGFRADARWLAVRAGLSVDQVCVALHSLLSARRLTLSAANSWHLETD